MRLIVRLGANRLEVSYVGLVAVRIDITAHVLLVEHTRLDDNHFQVAFSGRPMSFAELAQLFSGTMHIKISIWHCQND